MFLALNSFFVLSILLDKIPEKQSLKSYKPMNKQTYLK